MSDTPSVAQAARTLDASAAPINNGLTKYFFEDAPVRIQDADGGLWFVLADVCRVLEIGNPRQAAAKLDEDERRKVDFSGRVNNDGAKINDLAEGAGNNEAWVISEPGLYNLIMKSRKPAAKRFKKWVTAEVLPTIRKTGSYGVPAAIPNLSDPLVLQQLLLEHTTKRIEAERRATVAERAVEEARPKAAFYDKFARAEGLYGLQNAGRVLGYGPNKFVSYLKQGYLFYQGGELIPKAQYRDMGLFEVKSTMVEDKARLRAYMTPKGLQYFAKKLGLPLPSEDIFAGELVS